MSNATVEVTGIGRVFIKTSANEISFCGAVTADGQPVNVTSKAVSRDKKHYQAAQEADAAGYWLEEVRQDTFRLVKPE